MKWGKKPSAFFSVSSLTVLQGIVRHATIHDPVCVYCLETFIRDGEMAQHIKISAAKTQDLSLNLETHVQKERTES